MMIAMPYLIFNSGSSSLKFAMFVAETERLLVEGSIDWGHTPTRLVMHRENQPKAEEELDLHGHAEAIGRILQELGSSDEITAIGHRVVHGGDVYSSTVEINAEVERRLAELVDLAPLHNASSLEVIRAARKALPGVPHFAAFDTAFHSTLSPAARTYPVPKQWTNDWHLRRYGFHGLSYAYCSLRAAELLPGRKLKLVIAHLGSGASLAAVDDGKSVDTTMGFTPLDGLMMGTRSGSVDPGILIYLLRHKGLSVDQLDHALNSESGLLGVSGVSSDLRDVLTACRDNGDARLAIDVYVHCLVRLIGGMAATLDGVDALVFTAGVGEHSAEIRRRVCGRLGFLGLELDEAANANSKPDADIASPTSRARILVIATREELTIARDIRCMID